MDLQLDDRVAVVTGGGSGIGRAVAERLLREGARVVVAGRTPQRLTAVAGALEAATGTSGAVLAVPTDTTDEDSVAAMVAATTERFGPIQVLVNAAAKAASPVPTTTWRDLTTEDALGELDTKLLGYLRCARQVAPAMVEGGWGRIVNISGLASRQTGSVIGSVRNVAVTALTKNLADELGPRGVNVTVVHPAFTRTERTPETLAAIATASDSTPGAVEELLAARTAVGRLVTAAEVANVVAFLASPLSVAINGESLGVGGGVRGPIYY